MRAIRATTIRRLHRSRWIQCTASTRCKSPRGPTRRRSAAAPTPCQRSSTGRCPCSQTARTSNGRDVTPTYSGAPQSTILSMLHGRASLRPDDVAFSFTDYALDPAGVTESLTWAQVSHRTMNVARELSLHASVGDRAVILAPQSLDYILAFLGSMRQGQRHRDQPSLHRSQERQNVVKALRSQDHRPVTSVW